MHKISKMKKPKSLKSPMPIVTPMNSHDNNAQFELELCWCIQQLEASLNSGKLSRKVADDTVKNLKVLKGNSAPLIKKRQVMKETMGDYRAKMKEEEKRMSLASKQIKFTPTTIQKYSFVKKSAILTSGKDFKFNFETKNTDDENQLMEQAKETAKNVYPKNLQFTSAGSFKFNFSINEVNNDLKFDELSIQ